MRKNGEPDESRSNPEMEWVFDHWHQRYLEHDPAPKLRAFYAVIITSVMAVALNAGAVEVSQSTLSGITIAPKSAVAIGAILTAASVGAFLRVLLMVLTWSDDDSSIDFFSYHGVKRAEAMKTYREWQKANEHFKGLSKAVAGAFAVVFLLCPIASIVTLILSLREVL